MAKCNIKYRKGFAQGGIAFNTNHPMSVEAEVNNHIIKAIKEVGVSIAEFNDAMKSVSRISETVEHGKTKEADPR